MGATMFMQIFRILPWPYVSTNHHRGTYWTQEEYKNYIAVKSFIFSQEDFKILEEKFNSGELPALVQTDIYGIRHNRQYELFPEGIKLLMELNVDNIRGRWKNVWKEKTKRRNTLHRLY